MINISDIETEKFADIFSFLEQFNTILADRRAQIQCGTNLITKYLLNNIFFLIKDVHVYSIIFGVFDFVS